MSLRVSASGEQTSLSERKRRAGQRLLLTLSEPRLGYDQRALLAELQPAGFVVDPTGADEPGQLRELAAELTARLPPALPPVLCARHDVGRPCPGATEQPPLRWLAGADDPALTRAVGRAWRRELAAMGFHLQLGPRCELEPAASETLPAGPDELGSLLAGDDPPRTARTIGAFVHDEPGDACAACPCFAQGWLRDGRLVAWEKELPGLLAEDLAPVEAAVRARPPALLLGWGRWPAFDEQRPVWATEGLMLGQLRQRLGFGGLLLAEDPSIAPEAERLRVADLLRDALAASLDLWILQPRAERQVALYEALVRLQERHPILDTVMDLTTKRLLRGRERLMLHRVRPGLEVVDHRSHRDLVLLARARGS